MYLFLLISAKYIKAAIMKDIIEIDKFERRTVSKNSGIKNFINPPDKSIGIVPKRIDFNNVLSKL